MKQIIETKPKIVKDFSCVGGSCREHCCQGWKITLDKPSVRRYLNSKEIQISSIAKSAIKITKKNPANWGEIIFSTKNSNCPFMDDASLCSIQGKMGAEALSPTCSTFPRASRIYKNEIEKYLNLSCPEVTHLLINNKDSMSMSESTHIQKNFNNAPTLAIKDKVISLFCQNIFNISEGSVEVHVYAMVKFLMVAEKVESIENSIVQLESLYYTLADEIRSGRLQVELSGIKQNYALKINIISLMETFFLQKTSARGGHVMKGYITQLQQQLITKDESQSTDLAMEKILAGWKGVADKCFDADNYLFKNYFKYKLWAQGFPRSNELSMLSNLYLIVAEFYFIKALLSAHEVTTGSTDNDDIINVIYSFHSLSQHNQSIQQVFNEYIHKVRCGDNLSLLQLLI